jgi:hypothetical protein
MTRRMVLLLLGCLALAFQSAQARPVESPKPTPASQPAYHEASSTGPFSAQSVPDAGATGLLLGGVLSVLAVARYSKR